jgi:hypothetical protein
LQIHDNEPEGDILVFLTGEKEIEDAVDVIEEEYSKYSYQETGPLRALPLYASLPPYEQQQVFEKAPPPHTPGGKPGRKVIISTNIAQTSVTIDGIVYVVDSGFIKQVCITLVPVWTHSRLYPSQRQQQNKDLGALAVPDQEKHFDCIQRTFMNRSFPNSRSLRS